uniref:NAD-dependent DNA ligase n=1 Tax=Dulem virus 36 TaxID=3145754 RepID=A0AAU8AZM3_9CAUD
MMAYKFDNPYMSERERISFLQRVVLVHSYLYYMLDNPVWSDRQYDNVSVQLVQMQNKHSKSWIKENTQYGYVFYDFDGTTGFDLYNRLIDADKKRIMQIGCLR